MSNQLPYYPLWCQLHQKLIYTVGQDCNVYVCPLRCITCNLYEITIKVRGKAKADAIRRMLPVEYEYGNVRVEVIVVVDGQIATACPLARSARDIANAVCTGLSGNRLFEVCAITDRDQFGILEEVVAVIKCDYQYGPAVDNFSEVFITEYGLILPTPLKFKEPHQCGICECDIYCVNKYC